MIDSYWSVVVVSCHTHARRLVNFLVFLRHGRYPSLLQRLTGMRLVYRDTLVRLHIIYTDQPTNRMTNPHH